MPEEKKAAQGKDEQEMWRRMQEAEAEYKKAKAEYEMYQRQKEDAQKGQEKEDAQKGQEKQQTTGPVKQDAVQPQADAPDGRDTKQGEAQADLGAVTRGQTRNIARLRNIADLNEVLRGSSREFKTMQKALKEMDEFMQEINGRTMLTDEEMRKYDKLAGSLQKSSTIYLEKKEKERDARERSGKKPDRSHYEDVRVRCAEEIQKNIEEMREKIFEERMKAKKQEMQAACDEKLSRLEEERAEIAGSMGSQAEKEEMLRENVAQTFYYSARMSTLQGDFKLKPGESMERAMERLDMSIRPKKEELDQVKSSELAKKVTEKGISKMEKKEPLRMEEIQAEQKKYVMNLSRQTEMQKEKQITMKQPERHAKKELEQSQIQAVG